MRHLVLTGASSGIGRALVQTLAEAELSWTLLGRREAVLEELVRTCGLRRAQVLAYDLRHSEAASQAIKEAEHFAGTARPTLVNCAGAVHFGPFVEISEQSLEEQLDINLAAPIRLARAFVPWALRSGGGHLINVLSVVAVEKLSGCAVYSAAKAGLLQFGRALATETRREGLQVSAVIPGAVDTPLWDTQSFQPDRSQMLTAEAVAETLRDLILLPEGRSIDEIHVLPPQGIL